MRTIDRLRYEFGVPIEYEETQRGYYLTHDDFSFAVPPATRDELLALSFASGFISIVEGPSVRAAMDSLWNRLLHARPEFERDKVSEKFSIGGHIAARMSGVDLLRLVLMCCQGNLVCVTYRSPWLNLRESDYRGHFDRVHCANGLFFAKFICCNGDALVFNLSFITTIEPLRDQAQSRASLDTTLRIDEGWYSGHGSWSGAIPERIEIAIRAPESAYYAEQIWNRDQLDRWEGGTLIRSFPSVVSIELGRLILALGRSVESVKPDWVLEKLRVDIQNLGKLCGVQGE